MRRHVGLWRLFRFVCLPLLLTVVFLVIQPVAEAQVTLSGSWDLSGKGRLCAKKVRCVNAGLLVACLDALEDGSFNWYEEGGTTSGTWIQEGKKFLIEFDLDSAAVLMESTCEEDLGASCDVTISTARIEGKIKEDNIRRGKMRIAGTITIQGQSFKFSFRSRGSLTGTRTEGCTTGLESTPFSTLQDTANSMLTNLAQQIFSAIR